MGCDTIFRDHAGKFDLKFNCKPQQWLTSGEEAVDMTYMPWVSGQYITGDLLYSDTGHDPAEYYYKVDPAGFVERDPSEIDAIATPLIDVGNADAHQLTTQLRVTNVSDRDVQVSIANVTYDENMQMLTNYEGSHYYTYIKTTILASGGSTSASSPPIGRGFKRWSVLAYSLDPDEPDVSLDEDLKIVYHIGRHGYDDEDQEYKRSNTLVINETNYPSRPIIEIDDPSTVRFVINDYTVEIGETSADTLIIDCELEDCYSYDSSGNVVNENGNVSISCDNPRELSDFPYIIPGENIFRTLIGEDAERPEGDVNSAIRIRPNWYRI